MFFEQNTENVVFCVEKQALGCVLQHCSVFSKDCVNSLDLDTHKRTFREIAPTSEDKKL